MSQIYIYANGLVCCSVCAPADMAIEEVTQLVNEQNPTGIHPWHLSADVTFANGEPMPKPCELNGQRVHYLFNC